MNSWLYGRDPETEFVKIKHLESGTVYESSKEHNYWLSEESPVKSFYMLNAEFFTMVSAGHFSKNNVYKVEYAHWDKTWKIAYFKIIEVVISSINIVEIRVDKPMNLELLAALGKEKT